MQNASTDFKLELVDAENAADIKKAILRAKNIAKHRRYHANNRAIRNEKSRKYWVDRPEKRDAANKKKRPPRSLEINQERNLRHKYGMSIADYNAMFERQGGRCSICLKHQSKIKLRLYVDHDHKTGAVRGLLCKPCNTVLGLAGDDIEVLQRAISYLEESRV